MDHVQDFLCEWQLLGYNVSDILEMQDMAALGGVTERLHRG